LNSSRSSLADYVLSRLTPSDMTARSPMRDYVFPHLLTAPPVRSRNHPRQRFAATQVSVPGAADHKAPEFTSPRTCLLDPHGNSDSQPLSPRSDRMSSIQESSPRHRDSRDSSPDKGDLETGSPRARFMDSESQPLVSPRPERPVVLRGVKMKGFNTPALNVLFVENPDPSFRVNGRETYWAIAADHFLYKSEATTHGELARRSVSRPFRMEPAMASLTAQKPTTFGTPRVQLQRHLRKRDGESGQVTQGSG